MLVEVTDENFDELVLKNKNLVLVDFWAEWCGPCKLLAPILEQLQNDLQDKVNIVKMNVDLQAITPSKYGIKGLPTIMIFKNGSLVDTKVGLQQKNDLLAWIERFSQKD